MIKITKARRGHLDGIGKLWEEFIDFHSDIDPIFTRTKNGTKGFKEYLSKTFGSRKQQLFVALDDKEVIGYALIMINSYPPVLTMGRYGYIQDMAISGKYRRKGIGEKLLKEVIKWFKQKKLTRVELAVLSKNKIGHSFWKKTGFTEFLKRMYLEM